MRNDAFFIVLLQIAIVATALAGPVQNVQSPNFTAIEKRQTGRGDGRNRGFGNRGNDDAQRRGQDGEPETCIVDEILDSASARTVEVIEAMQGANRREMEMHLEALNVFTATMAGFLALRGMRDVDEITAYIQERNTVWDESDIRTLAQTAIEAVEKRRETPS